jgi:hypothetical protein
MVTFIDESSEVRVIIEGAGESDIRPLALGLDVGVVKSSLRPDSFDDHNFGFFEPLENLPRIKNPQSWNTKIKRCDVPATLTVSK